MQRIAIAGHRAVQSTIAATCLALAVACRDESTPLAPRAGRPALTKGSAGNSTAGGRIFFAAFSGPQQSADVFVMNADGTGVAQLTAEPGPDGMPSAPLDGRSVVFVSRRSGQFEIYAMKPDGGGVTRLTTSERGDSHPAISADGRRVAFTRLDPVTFEVDLFVMRPNGTNVVQITNDAAEERSPTFSPDGQQIAFERWENGDREIYRINIDGTGLVNLTNNPTSEDVRPAWAPDGSLIAFGSERDGQDATGEPDIYTMHADGSNVVRRTTFGPGGAQGPAWSPDSKRLVFFNWAGATPAIYVMNLDGTGLTPISQMQASAFSWTR
jgi:Tol biopolymer transport system component